MAMTGIPDIVARLYAVVDELQEVFPGRPFTPDGHMVGSLGECLAAYAFDLELQPPSTPSHHALTHDGLTVEIKATQGSRVLLSARVDPMPDRLIALALPRGRSIEVVYNGPAAPAWAAASKPQKNGQMRIDRPDLRSSGYAHSPAS